MYENNETPHHGYTRHKSKPPNLPEKFLPSELTQLRYFQGGEIR